MLDDIGDGASGKRAKSVDLTNVLSLLDIRRYENTRNFSIRDWYAALSRRVHVKLAYSEGVRHLYVSRLIDIIKDPLADGVVDLSYSYRKSVSDLLSINAWEMREIIEGFPDVCADCIRELDGPDGAPGVGKSEVVELDSISEDDWMAALDAVKASSRDTSGKAFSSFNDLLVSGAYEREIAYAEIDLSAPDDVIFQDFKLWIEIKRASNNFENSPVRRFKEKDLVRWSHNLVLPYIDLTSLLEACGVYAANHVIGEALFPANDVDVSEKIRKTVAPMAKELMSFAFLDALRHAASSDIRAPIERKKSDR